MADRPIFDPGKLGIFTFILYSLFSVVLCNYECFYLIEEIGDIQYLGSFPCRHGCCGTTEHQRCCTEEERFKDDPNGSRWRVAAFVLLGLLGLVAMVIIGVCVIKRANKKKMTVYDIQSNTPRRRNVATAPTLPPPPYTYLPTGSTRASTSRGMTDNNDQLKGYPPYPPPYTLTLEPCQPGQQQQQQQQQWS